jgi:hypothetical protein
VKAVRSAPPGVEVVDVPDPVSDEELVTIRSASICAAGLLARRPELVDTVVTHRFPLADAPEAFRVAADKTSGAIRVVLEP